MLPPSENGRGRQERRTIGQREGHALTSTPALLCVANWVNTVKKVLLPSTPEIGFHQSLLMPLNFVFRDQSRSLPSAAR